MKYMGQLCIILLVCFLGEVLHLLIPLPVPAGIYGMVLLFLGLMTGIIRLSSVRETGRFLIDIMPVFFIAPTVALIDMWGVIQPIFLPYAVIIAVSTVAVMVTAGRVTQAIIHRGGKAE